MIENVDVEFKELDKIKGTLPGSLSKDIAAFANTLGGEIYIGIKDDGSIAGVENPDDVMTRISNLVHDSIIPDLIPFIQIQTIEKNKKHIIKITVSPGTQRPYYLAKDGLKPKGVYVRRGSACIPVSEAGIREMIMETSGKSFEESRSLNQDLTFETLNKEMQLRNLEFNKPQMRTLKLIGTDNLYTNLALLLSDQCPYTTKIAVFQGSDNAVFRERKEFGGSLLKQLSEAYHFLDFFNKTKATFNELIRTDQRDYPEEAIREALLNGIIHRDYLFSGSNIINMYDNQIEFISLGSLISGLSLKSIFMGASQSRNPNLAAVFYRLKLVESYGTGVRKINRLYKDYTDKPLFQTAEGVFSVTLPNQNNANNIVKEESTQYNFYTLDIKNEILNFIKFKKKITRKDIENKFGFGTTKSFNLLKELCENKLIRQIKQGKQTVYII